MATCSADRIVQFQLRLASMEAELAEVKQWQVRVEGGLQALRQEVIVLCLGTVAELVQQALRNIQRAPGEMEQLQIIEEQTQEPSDASRMAAYQSLRFMHVDCSVCKHNAQEKERGHNVPEVCATNRALLLMRDLLLLTMCLGKEHQTNQRLKTALQDALLRGCGRTEMDPVEQWQL